MPAVDSNYFNVIIPDSALSENPESDYDYAIPAFTEAESYLTQESETAKTPPAKTNLAANVVVANPQAQQPDGLTKKAPAKTRKTQLLSIPNLTKISQNQTVKQIFNFIVQDRLPKLFSTRLWLVLLGILALLQPAFSGTNQGLALTLLISAYILSEVWIKTKQF